MGLTRASAPVRALRSIRSRGGRETWKIATRESRRTATYKLRALLGWWFDLTTGVSTRQPFEHHDLGVAGTLYEDSRVYAAAPHWTLRRLVRGLGIDPAEFTFVDLGSGRGRILFAAAKLGFRRVVGVELSAELAEATRRNIETYRGPPATFTVHHLDATRFEFPEGPLFVFLFDPFGDRVVAQVAANLERALHSTTRTAFVIYYRAWYRNRFAELSTLKVLQDDLDWAIYGTPSAG